MIIGLKETLLLSVLMFLEVMLAGLLHLASHVQRIVYPGFPFSDSRKQRHHNTAVN